MYFAKAARQVATAAKEKHVSFFALFFADAGSVFGNRQDHDKYEIFARLSKECAIAPYLAKTALLAPSANSVSTLPPSIRFPVVVKPIWGAQSVGVLAVRDPKTLFKFLKGKRITYIAQTLIQEGCEIGVSYTRNPEGPPDFFGVARKVPVYGTDSWKFGYSTVPDSFYHYDETRNIDGGRLRELCRTIADTLGSNSIRLDAFIRRKGKRLQVDTLQIIDVNTGVFAVDEFLFDSSHPPALVIDQLTRKYTFLLMWGARHSPNPRLSAMRNLIFHLLYCWLVIILGHVFTVPMSRTIRNSNQIDPTGNKSARGRIA
ncbi:MAG: hypothetical protein ACXWJW_04530 [Xanthobacteraceae bacterium]